MKRMSPTHWAVANSQILLSFFFLGGFFVLCVLQGTGRIKLDAMGGLGSGVTMILSFWFMRQRVSGNEAPDDDPVAGPVAPVPVIPTPVVPTPVAPTLGNTLNPLDMKP